MSVGRRPWVLVRAAGEVYAWPAHDVEEVRESPAIVPVPHAPAAVRGVLRYESGFLPVVDLAAFVGRPAATGDPWVLIGRWGPRRAAWLVEEVVDVVELEEDRWMPPPPGSPPFVHAVAAVGATLVARFDTMAAAVNPGEEPG